MFWISNIRCKKNIMEHDTNICSRYLYNVTNFKYVRIMDLKCDIDDDMQLFYGIDALV